ncbi:MAG: hypothetical protein ACFFDI_31165 [Promethearchaeota archaeon]
MNRYIIVFFVLISLFIVSTCDKGGDRQHDTQEQGKEKPQPFSSVTKDLPRMPMQISASVKLDDPRRGGTVNYISAPDLIPGAFICDVGPYFAEGQAMEINLAFPYEGGAVTRPHTDLPHVVSPLPGVTDIEVPLGGKLTKLSYRLAAMPAQGEEKVFKLYFYRSPPLPEGKAIGWSTAMVRREDNTLFFSFYDDQE